MSTLAELQRKVESAEGPDRELDADLFQACGGKEWDRAIDWAMQPCGCPMDVAVADARRAAPSYTNSVDAALALVERNPIEGQDSVDIVLGALASMVQSASYRPKKPLSDQLARGVIAEYLKALSQKEAGDA